MAPLSPLVRTPIKGYRDASISKYVRRVKALSFQTFLCGVGAGVYFGQCFDFRSCILFLIHLNLI